MVSFVKFGDTSEKITKLENVQEPTIYSIYILWHDGQPIGTKVLRELKAIDNQYEHSILLRIKFY